MQPLQPEAWEPPVQQVSCGSRRDLFKKQRRHGPWLDAGLDVRHDEQGGFVAAHITICGTCGRERWYKQQEEL
jgi:hypothetical protein